MANYSKFKTAFYSALIFSSLVFASASAQAQTAEEKAQTDYTIQIAVAKASKAWKDAFNSGNAAAAAALYEEDAVMVAKPFGTFKGREAILAFWTNLVTMGFDDVVYRNTVTTILDGSSARVAADWSMNNASGVITNELWVIQSDGSALLREDHFEVAQ